MFYIAQWAPTFLFMTLLVMYFEELGLRTVVINVGLAVLGAIVLLLIFRLPMGAFAAWMALLAFVLFFKVKLDASGL